MLPAITAPVMRFLGVSDAARAAAFYRDVLGFEIREVDGAQEAHRGPARLRFGPHDYSAPYSELGDPRPVGSAMVFFETDDLDAMRAAIAERGGEPSAAEKLNWIKMRMFYLRDPDGHTLWFGKSYHAPDFPKRPGLLRKALPELPCGDVTAAIAHYRDVLGFSINYRQDDLGVMERDEVTVLLVPRRHPGAGSASFYIGNADALHAELVAKGAKVEGPPVSRPWGLRDFAVHDLEGNELRFAQTFE